MSEPVDCWILPHEKASGPENMAKDEALLDFASSHPGQSIFRTYEWSEPTLSLGYFQLIESAESDQRWKGATVVRRLTGGGALWHDAELTYALILSTSHPLSSRTAALYEWVHEAIVRVLSGQGLHAARRGTENPDLDQPAKPFLCFCDRNANDIILHGHKIVGSAQRRRSGAILQHGSILLRQSPRTPELQGIIDLAENTLGLGEVRQRLLTELPEALHFHNHLEEWPGIVVERTKNLIETHYRNDSWNRRR